MLGDLARIREISNGNSFCKLDGRVSVILEDIFLGQYPIFNFTAKKNSVIMAGIPVSVHPTCFFEPCVVPELEESEKETATFAACAVSPGVWKRTWVSTGEWRIGAEILTWSSQDLRF